MKTPKHSGRIYKAKQDKKFTVIPNSILENKDLSLKAIGLLCCLLKLPEDWNIHKSKLYTLVKDGRDAVINAFEELVDCGYIRVEKVKNGKNQFLGYNYFIYNESQSDLSPFPEKPVTEKPVTEKPVTENTELQKTVLTKDCNTKDCNTDIPAKAGSDKIETEYQEFIKIYDNWFKRNNGIPAKIDGVAGNAAKSLIGYLKSIVKSRIINDKKELTPETLRDGLMKSWRDHILGNWDKLEPFYQDKTRMVDINSNIQNIITQIKDGARKKTSGSDNGSFKPKSKLGTSAARVEAARDF